MERAEPLKLPECQLPREMRAERLLSLHEDNPGQEMGILKCRDLSALRDVARPSLGVSVAGESIDLSSLSPTTLAELDAAASAARKRSCK